MTPKSKRFKIVFSVLLLVLPILVSSCPEGLYVTVTFNSNGGTAANPSSLIYKVGSNYGALAVTSRVGYSFAGWWTSLEQDATEIKTNSIVTNEDSHTLYAKWIAVEYTITYTLNGGTNSEANPSGYRIFDTPINLSEPTRQGFDFLGWSLYEDSEIYQNVVPQGTTGDIHFYAQWDENRFLLTFSPNGGSAANPGTKWVSPGSLYGELATTTRAGYNFAGWWTQEGGTGSEITSNSPVVTQADHTLYAKWTLVIYDIEYVLAGGTNNAANPSTYSILDTPITLSNPTKADHSFGGWFSDAEFTVATNGIAAGGSGDKTFYAKWLGYDVGNPGPAGGYIFYDKGSYSDGWRYLEVAPYSVESNFQSRPFGNYRTSPQGDNLLVGGTLEEIGTGELNTQLLVNAMGDAAYISNNSSITDTTSSYAAKLCQDLEYGGYSDWYLPSIDELNAVYLNLKKKGLGGYFSSSMYWSSTETGGNVAAFVNFSNGTIYEISKAWDERIRPIRNF
jgi:uncharacterized repeat protein (TIGR02543 family)